MRVERDNEDLAWALGMEDRGAAVDELADLLENAGAAGELDDDQADEQ